MLWLCWNRRFRALDGLAARHDQCNMATMHGLDGTSLRQMLQELKAQVAADNVFNGAAALAFYLTLAIFPGLIFLLSVLPYLPIPNLHQAIMDLIGQALPQEAATALTTTVEKITSQRRGGLLSFGLVGMLWVASTAMYAVMQHLNITYRVKEGRPFLKARGTSLLLTLLFGSLVIGAFALVVSGGVLQAWLASHFGWSAGLVLLFATLRWVIIIAALLLGFALVYYLAPNVDQKLKWVTPGAVLGVATLVLASLLLRLYVESFGHYDATYGSIGAIIVLMLALYVVGLVLLMGSEVNVVYEKHAPGGKKRGEKRAGESGSPAARTAAP